MFLLVNSDLRVRWVFSASRLGVLVCDKKWCSVTAAWESLSLTTNSAEKECRYAQRHRYGPPARPLARLVAANCDSFPQAIDIFERYNQTKAANHLGCWGLSTNIFDSKCNLRQDICSTSRAKMTKRDYIFL